MVIDGYKMCSKCRKFMPISKFGKNRASKDRFCNYCKICRYDYIKEYYLKKLGRIENEVR